MGERFPWGESDEWLALVTDGRVLRSYMTFADAGATAGRALTALTLEADAARAHRREALVADLERRLCVPPASPPCVRASVVICTHRRPAQVARLLEAVGRLDPPAHEVIVVDNDPGEEDVAAVAESFGARYLHQAERGLNRARARGVAAATGDVVVFCDDDCLPPDHWLEPLGRAFADGTVGAVTGPAVALGIETEAQLLRDRYAGFVHPLGLRRADWTTVAPVAAGSIGAGANMAFRRALLEQLGEVFPSELDAGTRTLSGGDLYALYRVLAAGAAIVRDPGFWLLHDHPPSQDALDYTLRAYGTGFSAFLTKVLVEERELSAVLHWTWLVRAALGARLRSLVHPDPAVTRLRRLYLLAGFRGTPAWLSTRPGRRARGAPAVPPRRGDVAPPPDCEVVVGLDPAARNARARAAAARWLVFLPDGAPDPGRQARLHLEAHSAQGRPALVMGSERVEGFGGGLTEQFAALRLGRRWATTCIAPTPLDLGGAGFSIARERFLELGGLREDMSGPGAGTDLAYAARDRGIAIVQQPAAATAATLPADLGQLADRARTDGRERAAMAARHAEVGCPVRISGAPLARLARTDAGVRAVITAAELLETVRFRGPWLRLVRTLHQASIARGWLEAGGHPTASAAPLRVDLADPAPIEIGGTFPGRVEVYDGARRLSSLQVRGERWESTLARDIVSVLSEEQVSRIAPAPVPVDPGPARCAVVSSNGGRPRWPDVERALRDARVPLVAVGPALEPSGDWLAVASAPLEGDRVGLVCGWAAAGGVIPDPTTLISDRHRRRAYPLLGPPWDFLVLSRDAYDGCGGVPADVAAGSVEVAVTYLIERLLAGGWTVALQQAPGADGAGERRVVRGWRLRNARGRLLGREAARRTAPQAATWLLGQGVLPEAGSLIRAAGSRSPRRVAAAAGDAAATTAGVVKGLRDARRRG